MEGIWICDECSGGPIAGFTMHKRNGETSCDHCEAHATDVDPFTGNAPVRCTTCDGVKLTSPVTHVTVCACNAHKHTQRSYR